MAKGDIHSLRVFNRALSADEVAGLCNQSIYSLRVDGKYGSAIALEDATTNVITNPLFNGPTGWAFSSDTAGSFSTADGWGKITKGTGTYDFLRQTLSLTGTYTGKITFKNDTIGQVGLRFSTGGGGQNITLTGTNDPIIVETTITASGTAYFDIILGSYYGQTSPASQVSFSYAQCEQKACSTSFVNGSRVRGLVNYPNPLQGLTQGTVSCWAKKSPLNMEGGALLAIDNNVDATSSLTIDFYASYMRFFIYDDAGNSYVVTVYTATDNNWHMYAFTFDGSKIIGYIDGITYGPTPYATVFTSKGTLKLCQRGNPTYSDRYGNFLIDELRIDKVARTADEIKAWHLSNAPYFPRGKERAVL
jgi:hypothetical protein